MKKKASICLLLIIIANILMANLVHGATTNPFSVTNAKGKKGDEVTVVISLDKELEFAAADLTLEYDPTKLEYVKYTELELFEASAMNIAKNNSDNGKIAIGYVSNPESNDLTKNPGKMLSITFKILTSKEENANLKLSVVSLKKDNGENIEASNINSKIKIVTKENKNQNVDNTNVDNTTVNYYNKEITKLPNTGSKMIYIISFIGICLIFSIYSYKKYIYLRKV